MILAVLKMSPGSNLSFRRYFAALNPPSPTKEEGSSSVSTGPKKDYTLKEGQTFSISIPGRNKSAGRGTTDSLLGSGSGVSSNSSGGAIPLLPPPPSASKNRT